MSVTASDRTAHYRQNDKSPRIQRVDEWRWACSCGRHTVTGVPITDAICAATKHSAVCVGHVEVLPADKPGKAYVVTIEQRWSSAFDVVVRDVACTCGWQSGAITPEDATVIAADHVLLTGHGR